MKTQKKPKPPLSLAIQAVYCLIGSDIGYFLGYSIWRYWDFRTHPGLYAMTSAPWYMSIQLLAVFAAVTLALLLALLWVLKKRRKR